MARVNIDGKIWKDPRVRRLAKRCGWSMRETVGTLAAVWDVAYDLKTEVMNAIDVDTAAELDGFAAHLQAADVELADRHSDTAVRLHGVLERIQYLLAQSDRGRAGGLARARKNTDRPSERQANAKRVLSTAQASLKQPPSLPLAPDLPPSPLPDLPLPPDLDPALGSDCAPPAARARVPREPSGPHQQAIAEFHGYFQRTHGGASPTWKGKNAKLMGDLVKAHGLHEIVRRVSVLERTPPSFPPAPWDMPTFAQHFDRIAQGSRNLTPLEAQMERVRMLEAEEAANDQA